MEYVIFSYALHTTVAFTFIHKTSSSNCVSNILALIFDDNFVFFSLYNFCIYSNIKKVRLF